MRAKLPILIALVMASAILMQACTESDPITSVNQDRIYQIYDARFNADSNTTYARATFRLENQNGSYITLTGNNAGVTFNSNVMSEVSIFGIVYYQYGSGGFLNPYQFVYTNANGETLQNSNSLSGMAISFQNVPTTISQSVDNTFSFTSSVNSGEKVFFNMYSVSNDSLVISRVNQTGGSSSFLITSAELQQLQTGSYYAQLTRQDQVGLSQQNSVGGVMNRSYVSTKAFFSIQ